MGMQMRGYLLIWSLLVWDSTRTLNDEDWDSLLPDLTTLCPNVDFCGKTQPGVEQLDDVSGANSCCRGCSCDSNCSKTRDCCDGTGDDDSFSECLVPSTNQDLRLNMYRFIVQPPADGCKKIPRKSQDENVTCSSDEKVAPWGNFFPVYSKSLDLNFKNEPCSRCHGALDVKKWTSILQIDYAPLFVGTLTQFIEKNALGGCDIVFRPPNSESSTFEKFCFRETRFCPRNSFFYILSNMQMNRSSIIQACEQGPIAKYLGRHGRAFKNVFCAVCNGYAREFDDKLRCEVSLGNDKDLDPPIRVLLDSESKASLTEKNKFEEKADGTCYRPEDNKNKSICEGTFCPSMQTRLQTGKCGYVTKFLMTENLILCLNISTSQGPNIDDVKEMSDTQIHSLFKKDTPWSNKWFITIIGLLISEKPRWLEFLVCLKLKTKQANIESLRKEIGSSLTKGWRVNFNVATVFDQTISKDGQISTGDLGNNVTAEWKSFKTNFDETLRAPIWKIMFTLDLDLRSPVYFNKMFMCEQIQLDPDEYKHASPESVLYQPKRHKYLYPNEFTALLDADGSWQVRVCLKDSGYIKVNSGTGFRLWVPVNIVIPIVSYKVIRVVTNTA